MWCGLYKVDGSYMVTFFSLSFSDHPTSPSRTRWLTNLNRGHSHLSYDFWSSYGHLVDCQSVDSHAYHILRGESKFFWTHVCFFVILYCSHTKPHTTLKYTLVLGFELVTNYIDFHTQCQASENNSSYTNHGWSNLDDVEQIQHVAHILGRV